MRSRMWGAALAVVVAGLASVPAVAAGERGVPECTNAELVAAYHRLGAATSHRYGRIALTNKSDHACSTRGYGGLSYVGGGDGTQIGAPAEREAGRVRSLVVQPGAKVVSRVTETSAGAYGRRQCRPAHVDGFRVYIPDETHSQYIKHPTTGCRNEEVHLLSHRAYRRP
jgi:hypothetical protein